MVKFTHVDATEVKLMKTWHDEGLGIKQIGKRLDRAPQTVSNHVFRRNNRFGQKPVGPPRKITPERFKKLMSTHSKLLAEAKGKREVTVDAVRRRARLKCSGKTISRAFAENGVRFRPLYEKPSLTDADKKERLAFAQEHKARSADQWMQYPHAIIDNKVSQSFSMGGPAISLPAGLCGGLIGSARRR